MLKYKKAIAVALFGLGLGASATALARPGYETCKVWWDQCNEGNQQACYDFDRLGCWWWDMG